MIKAGNEILPLRWWIMKSYDRWNQKEVKKVKYSNMKATLFHKFTFYIYEMRFIWGKYMMVRNRTSPMKTADDEWTKNIFPIYSFNI